jgi:hypothetical protein
MFPGSDMFARVPFHVAHTVLEKGTQNAFEITNDESSKHMWSNPLLGP